MAGTSRNRIILLSGGAGITQRAVQLVAGLVTLPLVLHALGLAAFGIWGAATSLAWAASMLDLGLGSALITLIPRAMAAEGHARAVTGASLAGASALSGLLLLAALAVALLAPHAIPGPAFVIAGLALALNIPLSLSGNIWFGLQKGYAAGFWELAQSLLMLAGIVICAATGAGVLAMVAVVYGALLAANAGSLTHLLLREPGIRPTPASLATFAPVLRSGVTLSALTLIIIASFVFDNLLALHWLGAAAAGRMAVAMRLGTTAFGFLAAATQALWPAFVEAVAANDHKWVWRTLWRGTAGITLLALTGGALLVAAGPLFLKLWLGQNIGLPRATLAVVAAWIIALAIPRVAGLLLNALLKFRGQIIVQSLATPLALALKYLLAPHFGIAGIFGATPLVWLVIVCPAYAWLALRWVIRRPATTA